MASQLYGPPGGVQAYTRRLAEVLTSYQQARGAELDCVTLADAESMPWQHSRPAEYTQFAAAGASKLRFTVSALRMALARRHRFALVTHAGLLPVAMALKSMRLLGGYCLVLHGIEAWRRLGWINRIGAARADCVVATTRHTASIFAELNGIDPEACEVIPLALSDDSVRPEPPAAPHAELRVLTVGRLDPAERYKGVDTLIAAVASARGAGADAELTVVGTGADRERLERLASSLHVERSVRFTGSVSDEELHQHYARCDVFAMPSRSEGFGIVFLEAMRYAKPCIGARSGGVPEVIDHGHTGYLIDYGSVEQLAQALLDLQRHPEHARQLGRQGLAKLRSQYLFGHMRDRWFELLDRRFGEPVSAAAQPAA